MSLPFRAVTSRWTRAQCSDARPIASRGCMRSKFDLAGWKDEFLVQPLATCEEKSDLNQWLSGMVKN